MSEEAPTLEQAELLAFIADTNNEGPIAKGSLLKALARKKLVYFWEDGNLETRVSVTNKAWKYI